MTPVPESPARWQPSAAADLPHPAIHKEIKMRRSVLIAYLLAAVFALAAVIPLVARPIHFERTLALGLVLAIAAALFGYTRSRAR